jgi:hypothetical protein
LGIALVKPLTVIFYSMDIPKVYISFDGDHIGRKVGQASLSDDPNEIRRISQAIEKGNEIWRSWAIVVGGDVISLGGDEGRICVGADHLDDLVSMQERYAQAVDATVSVGVGLKLSEADKALMSSKLHGGARITFYTPEIEKELEDLENEHRDEGDKLFDEYLDKSDGGGGIEHPLAGQFQQIVDEQEAMEESKRQAAEQNDSLASMKSQVVSILQAVRANAKELEGLKGEAPHLYESIQQLVQALIVMGRQLNPQPAGEPMQKSEAQAPKAKHFVMHYPIGFLLSPGPGTQNSRHGGRIKVAHTDGKTSWVAVRSGMVMGPDGAPASSRNPSGGAGGQ